MADKTPIAALFKLTPQEAVDYLQGRGQLAQTFSWQDMWQEEHAHQFTVSRLANLDLLQSIQDGITRSVNGDLSRRDWTKSAQALLEKAGWWGRKEVLDPATGEMVTTTFDPARLKLIFDTNTRIAYSAGLWQRTERNKKTHPYIRYITKRDERVRLSHRAWDNVTLPVDHPFWQTHFPPNGWRCRCRATTISQAEYDKGLSPLGETLNKTAPDVQYRDWINKRSGVVERVPVGIDPGFGYNPGMARNANLLEVASGKLDATHPPLAAATVRELVASEAFKVWFKSPQGNFPLVIIAAEDAAAIGSQRTVASLSSETAAKQASSHPELTTGEYSAAQKVVDLYTAKVQDGGNSLIYILEELAGESGGYVLVVKATKTGKGLFVTSYRKLSRQDAERETEIARLLLKGNR